MDLIHVRNQPRPHIATSHAHTLGVSGQWLRPSQNLPPDGLTSLPPLEDNFTFGEDTLKTSRWVK